MKTFKKLNNKNNLNLEIWLFISTLFIIIIVFPLYADLNRIEFLLPCLILGFINYIIFGDKWFLTIANSILSGFLAIILIYIFKFNKLITLNNMVFTILSWTIIIFIVYLINFFINE